MKKPPKCLKVYDSLPRTKSTSLQNFRMRIVQYNNSPALLDIREFVRTDKVAFYSAKGVALTKEQLYHIYKNMDDILKTMRSIDLHETIPVTTTNKEESSTD